jgi:hypothetical protein
MLLVFFFAYALFDVSSCGSIPFVVLHDQTFPERQKKQHAYKPINDERNRAGTTSTDIFRWVASHDYFLPDSSWQTSHLGVGNIQKQQYSELPNLVRQTGEIVVGSKQMCQCLALPDCVRETDKLVGLTAQAFQSSELPNLVR